jgi:hypothetical protein
MKKRDIEYDEACKHLAECRASIRVLFHKDECEQCDVAEKFRTEKVMV